MANSHYDHAFTFICIDTASLCQIKSKSSPLCLNFLSKSVDNTGSLSRSVGYRTTSARSLTALADDDDDEASADAVSRGAAVSKFEERARRNLRAPLSAPLAPTSVQRRCYSRRQQKAIQ